MNEIYNIIPITDTAEQFYMKHGYVRHRVVKPGMKMMCILRD